MKNAMKVSYKGNDYVCSWEPYIVHWKITVNIYEQGSICGFPWYKKLASYEVEPKTNISDMGPDELQKCYYNVVAKWRKEQENFLNREEYSIPKSPLPFLTWCAGLTAAGLLLLSLVTSCNNRAAEAERWKPKVVGTRIERFILVDMNPPKHFYVTLKSVEDGRVYERAYVSKHCNSYRDNPIGEEYNIHTTVIVDPKTNTQSVRLDNLSSVFCS